MDVSVGTWPRQVVAKHAFLHLQAPTNYVVVTDADQLRRSGCPSGIGRRPSCLVKAKSPQPIDSGVKTVAAHVPAPIRDGEEPSPRGPFISLGNRSLTLSWRASSVLTPTLGRDMIRYRSRGWCSRARGCPAPGRRLRSTSSVSTGRGRAVVWRTSSTAPAADPAERHHRRVVGANGQLGSTLWSRTNMPARPILSVAA
jgi:hypothetical protein